MRYVVVLVACAAASLLAPAHVHAQAADNPFIVWGNYCGLGNRGPVPPTDALDAICARHDACVGSSVLPACACNQRFVLETGALSRDPRQPVQTRQVAAEFGDLIGALPCDASRPLVVTAPREQAGAYTSLRRRPY